MSNMKIWLSAMRLRTLPLSVSGIFVGSCLAYYATDKFNILVFIFAITSTIGFQILSNLSNDYGDGTKGIDNEDRIGPERTIQSGQISPDQMLIAIQNNIMFIIFSVFALIYSAFGVTHILYAFIFIILAAIAVYSALTYTVGESPYGYKGFGDLFVFIFFGFVSVTGTYFLNALRLDHVVILPAIAIGLLSVGVLNLNNMRDINSDEKSGKNTLAVKIGSKRAKQYHLFLIFAAVFTSILFSILYYSSPYNFIFYLAFIPIFKHVKVVINAQHPSEYDPQLKFLAISTFIFSILLGLGQVLY